jgi:hypothetical protein
MRSMDYPWIFARDVPSICSTDPHDVKFDGDCTRQCCTYALPLTHDDVDFWMWVMTHGDHWCIL